MNVSSKAQFRNMQTIIVLLVFVIIFFVLIIVIFQFIFSNEIKTNNQQNKEMLLQHIDALLNFRYFRNYDKQDSWDIYKVKAFHNLQNKDAEFNSSLSNILGFSTVVLHILNSDFNTVHSIVIYNKTPNGFFYVTKFIIPILVYNTTSDTSTLSLLNISFYSK